MPPRYKELESFPRDGTQSATRWLRRFNRLRGKVQYGSDIPPSEWLEEIDIHLTHEAADCADRTPAIRRMVSEDYLHRW